MSIRGTIGINAKFFDRSELSGVSSMKALSLHDVGEYTDGKVAIVSGTVGTATATISVSPSTYRDAGGSLVSFAAISRVAIQADRRVILKNSADLAVISSDTLASVSDAQDDAGPLRLFPGYTSGSATYTLVIYGT